MFESFETPGSALSRFIVDFTQLSSNFIPYHNLNLPTKSSSVNTLPSSWLYRRIESRMPCVLAILVLIMWHTFFGVYRGVSEACLARPLVRKWEILTEMKTIFLRKFVFTLSKQYAKFLSLSSGYFYVVSSRPNSLFWQFFQIRKFRGFLSKQTLFVFTSHAPDLKYFFSLFFFKRW